MVSIGMDTWQNETIMMSCVMGVFRAWKMSYHITWCSLSIYILNVDDSVKYSILLSTDKNFSCSKCSCERWNRLSLARMYLIILFWAHWIFDLHVLACIFLYNFLWYFCFIRSTMETSFRTFSAPFPPLSYYCMFYLSYTMFVSCFII